METTDTADAPKPGSDETLGKPIMGEEFTYLPGVAGELAHVPGATIVEVAKLVRDAEAIKVVSIDVEGEKIPFAFRKGSNGDAIAVDILGEVDKWRTRPTARKGVAAVDTRASFVDLVDRHKDDGSALFASVSKEESIVVCVVDYHTLGKEPRFGRHRITYNFPLSEDWKRWVGIDNYPMSQADFAEFVEERFIDLSTPTDDERRQIEVALQTKFGTPAEILTLARGLEVNENVRVANAVTLQNGTAQIQFESTHTNAKGEALVVAGVFMLSIPMFEGSGPVRIPVRLRYTLRGGSISWKFVLYRPEDFVRSAVEAELAIVQRETGLPLYFGRPEGDVVSSFRS